MRAHVVSQKLNREQTKEYYTNTKIEFPVDYLDVLKDFTLNEPVDLYAPEFAYGAGIFSSRKDLMEEKLGTNQGILFQMGEAYKCYRSIEDFTPLTAEQKAVLEALPSPAYKQLLTVLNDKLLKKIELNKQKTGYKINEIGKVTNEELFSTIISKFRNLVRTVPNGQQGYDPHERRTERRRHSLPVYHRRNLSERHLGEYDPRYSRRTFPRNK